MLEAAVSGSQSGKAPPRVRPAASARVSRLGGIAAYLRAGAASVALWRVLRRREREPRAKPESVFGFIALPDTAEERAQKNRKHFTTPANKGQRGVLPCVHYKAPDSICQAMSGREFTPARFCRARSGYRSRG